MKIEPMKLAAIFIFGLLLSMAHTASAQEDPDQEDLDRYMQLCKNYMDDAWFYGRESANTLQFSSGANNLDDIRQHCFDALSSMDSLDLKLQYAIYCTDDAIFEAGNQDKTAMRGNLLKIKSNLKAASGSLGKSRDYLSLALDENDPNAMGQQLFDSVDYLNDCRQAIKDAQRELKNSLKNKP